MSRFYCIHNFHPFECPLHNQTGIAITSPLSVCSSVHHTFCIGQSEQQHTNVFPVTLLLTVELAPLFKDQTKHLSTPEQRYTLWRKHKHTKTGKRLLSFVLEGKGQFVLFGNLAEKKLTYWSNGHFNHPFHAVQTPFTNRILLFKMFFGLFKF